MLLVPSAHHSCFRPPLAVVLPGPLSTYPLQRNHKREIDIQGDMVARQTVERLNTGTGEDSEFRGQRSSLDVEYYYYHTKRYTSQVIRSLTGFKSTRSCWDWFCCRQPTE